MASVGAGLSIGGEAVTVSALINVLAWYQDALILTGDARGWWWRRRG